MAKPLLPTGARNSKRQIRYSLICDRNEITRQAIPKERMKTVIAALLLFISSLCTSFSISFLNEVVPRNNPLPDIVFKLVPMQEWAWPTSDLLVVIMASVCGFSLLLHQYRWIVMRRIFLIASVLYYLRAIAMLVTWMPLSDRHMLSKCITPASVRPRPTLNATLTVIAQIDLPWSMIGMRMVRYGLSMGFVGMEENRVLCGDYIYSGHTLMYVLTTLTIKTYFPHTGFYGFLNRLYPLAMICGMILVVISRLHYTIDVLIAYWMTTLTFWCYHLLISLPRSTVAHGMDRIQEVETGSSTVLEMAPNDPDDDDCSKGMNEWKTIGFGERMNWLPCLFGSRLVLNYFEKNVPPGIDLPRRVNWPYRSPNW